MTLCVSGPSRSANPRPAGSPRRVCPARAAGEPRRGRRGPAGGAAGRPAGLPGPRRRARTSDQPPQGHPARPTSRRHHRRQWLRHEPPGALVECDEPGGTESELVDHQLRGQHPRGVPHGGGLRRRPAARDVRRIPPRPRRPARRRRLRPDLAHRRSLPHLRRRHRQPDSRRDGTRIPVHHVGVATAPHSPSSRTPSATSASSATKWPCSSTGQGRC